MRKHSNIKPKAPSKRNHEWIHFTPKEVKCLFVYYVVLLIIASLWLTASVYLQYELEKPIFSKYFAIFMFACPGGLLGAVIYYIRKLYKACLHGEVIVPEIPNEEIHIKKIGAKIYFYSRPIISGILAIIMDMGILAGFYFITDQRNINDRTFYVFFILVSFYIGFCNGRVILNIEKKGNDMVNNLFKTPEDKNGHSSQ